MTRATVSARVFAGTILAAFALLGLVLATGSIPHAHTGLGPGLYNQEHDLTLLAAVGAAAATPEAPSVAPLVVIAGALALASFALVATPRSLTHPRAPPLR